MLEVAIKRWAGTFTLEVTLQAASGVTALFGPSGAGKTTLARCVAGLARPDQGRIVLNGHVSSSNQRAGILDVLVFHSPNGRKQHGHDDHDNGNTEPKRKYHKG